MQHAGIDFKTKIIGWGLNHVDPTIAIGKIHGARNLCNQWRFGLWLWTIRILMASSHHQGGKYDGQNRFHGRNDTHWPIWQVNLLVR